MKRFLPLLFLIFFVFGALGPAFAYTEKRIDLDKLDPATAAQVLQQLAEVEKKEQAEKSKKAEAELALEKLNQENIKTYESIALSVVNVIKKVCEDLSLQVNEFVKTPVGLTVMGLIVYHMAGDTIMFLIIGAPLIMLLLTSTLISFRHFHMPRKVKRKDKDSGEILVEWVRPKVFESNDARVVSTVVHVVVFVLTIFITVLCV